MGHIAKDLPSVGREDGLPVESERRQLRRQIGVEEEEESSGGSPGFIHNFNAFCLLWSLRPETMSLNHFIPSRSNSLTTTTPYPTSSTSVVVVQPTSSKAYLSDAGSSQDDVPRAFVKGSSLHDYLLRKVPEMISANLDFKYSLNQVAHALRTVIVKEKLLDAKNPCMVLCDQDLENVLNCKALSVNEIRDRVRKHLRQPDVLDGVGTFESLRRTPDTTSTSCGTAAVAGLGYSVVNTNAALTTLLATSSTSDHQSLLGGHPLPNGHLSETLTSFNSYQPLPDAHSAAAAAECLNVNGCYRVKPLFREVLRLIPGVDHSKEVFSYRELTALLSRYILDNKKSLFDPRNKMVVICRDDPLGKAFQVDAFHRCQVTSLLKTQILDPEPEVIDLTIVKEHLSDDGYGSQQTLSPEDNEVHEEEAVKVEEVPEEKNTFDVDAYYKATPELLEVIKSVPGVKNDKEVFSYKELSGLLSSYIINNRQTLFNANAPMVVDCKGDLLEKAFDVESFHRSEVSDLLRSRLIKVDNKEPEEKFELSTSYRPSPGFRKVLELASGGKGKDIYTFKEIATLLAKYIGDRKQSLIDPQAHMVINCKGDPIGEAFKVATFHRTEIPSLLRNQLTRVSNMEMDDMEKTSNRKRSPRDDSTTDSDGQMPDSSSSNQRRHKRKNRRISVTVSTLDYSSSEEEDDGKVDDKNDTIIKEETNQSKSEGDSEDHHDDDEDCFEVDNVYSVEYELENDSDEEEKSENEGSDSGSDSSCSEDLEAVVMVGTVAAILDTDFGNLGDSSDTEESVDSCEDSLSNYDPEIGLGDVWRCVKCHQPNTPKIRYCQRCWKERKGWVPDRPKPKKKKQQKSKATDGQILKGNGSRVFSRSTSENSATDSGFSASSLASSQPSSLSSEELEQPPPAAPVKKEPEVSDSRGVSDPAMICDLCCVRPKDSSFIHGKYSHQVCCYRCAKKLYKQKKPCPVCRRKIEKITKHILA